MISPQRLHARTFRPSSKKVIFTFVGLSQCGQTNITLERGMGAGFWMRPPCNNRPIGR
jgi:hypothetical protein